MNDIDPAYVKYWERKRLLTQCPHFPVIRCAKTFDGEVLSTISSAISSAQSLLDVGAGNLQVRDALRQAGFSGAYRTLDIGDEQKYDYRSLSEVSTKQGAILILDVIEHLPLRDGLGMLQQAIDLLEPSGVLVVQTPNGRCVRSPFISDMTHMQAYNLPDLWAFVTAAGCEAVGYRVSFEIGNGLLARLQRLVNRIVITQTLGMDYADNILLVARKRPL